MVTVKANDVLKGLGKKGFSLSQGDHSHLIFCVGGKKTAIRTKVSQGRSEIDDHLVNLMSIQVKLEKNKFMDLINCPLTVNDYLKELKRQGITFT